MPRTDTHAIDRPTKPLARAWLDLAFAICVPIAFGLASLAIGQDTNWDLRNYHRYNPWALLTGRLDTDLAPAGMPSYFNPLLDVPHYLASQWMAPKALAFLMGALHGLNAVLLYRIASCLLLPRDSRLVVALVALGGSMGSAFLSELGNTMGDNLTAVAMLAAFALVLSATAKDGLGLVLLAGLVAGLGIGAKLTNLPYGLGLVACAIAAQPSARHGRVRRVLVIGVGLALGVAIAYGYWASALWSQFGSPVFPQFNRLFDAPLAAASLVVDDRWTPRGWFEYAFFPFVFTLFPMRISEWPIVNVLWPVAYALLITCAARRVTRRVARDALQADATVSHRRLLPVFMVTAYVAWMSIFGIGRYAIVLEQLLPLCTWLLLHALLARRLARAVGFVLLAITIAFPLLRFDTWGNGRFADPAYRVETPAVDDPARATVLVLTAPVAWMLPDFPHGLAFASLDSGFPESPAYVDRVRRIIATRGGPVFAILPVDGDDEGSGKWKLNRLLASLSVRDGDLLCRYARAIMDRAPASDVVFDEAHAGKACRFRRGFAKDGLTGRDARSVVTAVARHGFAIDLARCTVHGAWIGERAFPYRFCPVSGR